MKRLANRKPLDGPSLALPTQKLSKPSQNPGPERSQPISYFQQLRAQNRLKQALNPFSKELARVDSDFYSFLPELTATAQKAIAHVAGSGGKRIRPAVFFASSRLFSSTSSFLNSIAVVCEYVHTASLLHDDVVDSSALRRGRATVNSVWGDQSSVLVGDLLYARASELMAATGSIDVVATFAQAIRQMSEGELLQLDNLYESNCETIYFQIIHKKTASLLAACCKVAAILGGGDQEQRSCLYKYGENLGFAFQLVDDALDYMSSGASLGKPALSDLREGKVTYPIIALKDQLSDSETRMLKASLACREQFEKNIHAIQELVQKYKSAEATIQLAAHYTQLAKESLAPFKGSDAYMSLLNFSESLNFRNF